jgi:hypothetical protein
MESKTLVRGGASTSELSWQLLCLPSTLSLVISIECLLNASCSSLMRCYSAERHRGASAAGSRTMKLRVGATPGWARLLGGESAWDIRSLTKIMPIWPSQLNAVTVQDFSSQATSKFPSEQSKRPNRDMTCVPPLNMVFTIVIRRPGRRVLRSQL